MAMNRKSGWSQEELELFALYLDQARRQGTALSAVFEKVAAKTGRQPGSVHNFYYAQRGEDGLLEGARVERDSRVFTKAQCLELLQHMMKAKARDISVRAAAQQLAQGDPTVMMRLQNKYRSLLRHHPQWVAEAARALEKQGDDFCWPTMPSTHGKRQKLTQKEELLEAQTQRIRQQQAEIMGQLRRMEQLIKGLDRILQGRRADETHQV